MQLTFHTDYALRVLLYLRLHPDRNVSIQEIASAYGISKNHLMKVVPELAKLGYVEARRGRGGGLLPARAPEEVNIGRVVRQMEANMTLVECFDLDRNTCPIEPACDLKKILEEAREAFLAALDRYTLADLGGRARALRKLLLIRLDESPAPRRKVAG